MKSITLALLAAFTAASFAADTPADIAADYREKAVAALTKVNDTLEKATVPLVAALVKSGDTAGADLLKEQLKAKLAGEPVDTPQSTAAALFKSYDTARAKALEPAQKSAIARIDAVLASSDGKKLDIVTELGKVRGEIEAGRVVDPKAIPVEWTYHQTLTGKPDADIWLRPGGVFEINDGSGSQFGRWKSKRDGFEIQMEKYTWKVAVAEGVGTISREVGTRYMKVKVKDSAPGPR